jgi:hypothetical protein
VVAIAKKECQATYMRMFDALQDRRE